MVSSHRGRPEGMGKLIPIGKVWKVRGQRGEVTVLPVPGGAELIAPQKSLSLSAEGGIILRIERCQEHKGRLILKFAGYNSIEKASQLVGKSLFISEEDLPPLPPDEFYRFQLIGMKMVDEKGKVIGKVVDIIDIRGGTDILVVTEGDKEYLIPAAKKYFVKIDLKNKLLVSKPPKGLLEINAV